MTLSTVKAALTLSLARKAAIQYMAAMAMMTSSAVIMYRVGWTVATNWMAAQGMI